MVKFVRLDGFLLACGVDFGIYPGSTFADVLVSATGAFGACGNEPVVAPTKYKQSAC